MASENRMIDVNRLKCALREVIIEEKQQNNDTTFLSQIGYLLDACPTVDAVYRGVHDQVRWERDIAIGQLESYGISLGEKADAVKVVRCEDCKSFTYDGYHKHYYCSRAKGLRYAILPDDFCSYGERKDNDL